MSSSHISAAFASHVEPTIAEISTGRAYALLASGSEQVSFTLPTAMLPELVRDLAEQAEEIERGTPPHRFKGMR